MSSVRFPGKVLAPLSGRPMLQVLLERLSKAATLDQVVVATTSTQADDELASFVCSLGFPCFRGSENNVLDRYYQAATEFSFETVVRITADCPLIDPEIVDDVVKAYQQSEFHLASNVNPPTFPDGLDVEAFSIGLLRQAWHEAVSVYDQEHVTPLMHRICGKDSVNITSPINLEHVRLTVDEPADLITANKVLRGFGSNTDFSYSDLCNLIQSQPEIFVTNAHLKRNAGHLLSAGQKLWGRAKRAIPGGNMFLSKRPARFSDQSWPVYFNRAKGVHVWDLDGTRYADCSTMGIGTNLLGYGFSRVDSAVEQAIRMGNMSTLNCAEEVYLCERMISLHPWASKARLARTGGEINAVAVRLARAATGRDKVAVCGYHGWHDWYLSANLREGDALKQHLLPGLNPVGIPASLAGTVVTFDYNSVTSLEQALLANPDVGAICMEVERNSPPEKNFLQEVRRLADHYSAVLIFDECSSGFRETLGGLHLKYGVSPDLATFGKALGNGYSITALIGKESVMDAAQETFMSSTFWSERIGPTAGLATLDAMEEIRAWEVVTATGQKVKDIWRRCSADLGVPISVYGLDAMATFAFNSERNLAYQSLMTDRFLRRGFLASGGFYASIDHTDELLERYEEHLRDIFRDVARCEDGYPLEKLFEGTPAEPGFVRLN